MQKYSPKIIGLFQALGLAAYIGFFAFGARTLLPILKVRFPTDPDPMISMTLFLLTFVTSALICSSIAFGYPTYLFLKGQKETAIPVVLWMILWLFLVLFASLLIVVAL